MSRVLDVSLSVQSYYLRADWLLDRGRGSPCDPIIWDPNPWDPSLFQDFSQLVQSYSRALTENCQPRKLRHDDAAARSVGQEGASCWCCSFRICRTFTYGRKPVCKMAKIPCHCRRMYNDVLRTSMKFSGLYFLYYLYLWYWWWRWVSVVCQISFFSRSLDNRS